MDRGRPRRPAGGGDGDGRRAGRGSRVGAGGGLGHRAGGRERQPRGPAARLAPPDRRRRRCRAPAHRARPPRRDAAAARGAADPPAMASAKIDGPSRLMVERLGIDVEDALDDLRNVARGVYPDVLRRAAWPRRCAPRRDRRPSRCIDDRGLRRRHDEAELTVYFCCLEALQNVAKHAGAGAVASVELAEDDRDISFVVEDDGVGFDVERVAHRAGLQNLADRLAAAAGTLHIASAPGRGTQVERTTARRTAHVPGARRGIGHALDPSPGRPRARSSAVAPQLRRRGRAAAATPAVDRAGWYAFDNVGRASARTLDSRWTHVQEGDRMVTSGGAPGSPSPTSSRAARSCCARRWICADGRSILAQAGRGPSSTPAGSSSSTSRPTARRACSCAPAGPPVRGR